MDDNYTKRKEGTSQMKDNCDIINLGQWLLDIISNMLGCNCKK